MSIASYIQLLLQFVRCLNLLMEHPLKTECKYLKSGVSGIGSTVTLLLFHTVYNTQVTLCVIRASLSMHTVNIKSLEMQHSRI
jgi:hypothetical protein